jgi:Peptidase family U32
LESTPREKAHPFPEPSLPSDRKAQHNSYASRRGASRIGEFLTSVGLPAGDLNDLPASDKRFPDGAQYRIEIPSTEAPACLSAVIEESSRRGVIVHRVSQGSGVLLLTDSELDLMAATAAEAKLEVSLAARPHAAWSPSAMTRSSAGGGLGSTAHGQDQVVHQLDDVLRAAAHGFRSVLITDIGTLQGFDLMKRAKQLPPEMQAKVSVLLPVANASAARVICQLGAGTLNLPTDLSLAQIAAIRSVIDIPLDIYIESADEFGGFLRYKEIPEIIRVASPVYLKFGLRNATDVYPSGTHLNQIATAISRERVRRAQLALELIHRDMPDAVTSKPGAKGLALVDPTYRTDGEAFEDDSEQRTLERM